MDECPPKDPESPPKIGWWPHTWPLYVRVLIGVIFGATIGFFFPSIEQSDGTKKAAEIAAGWTTVHLSSIAGMYIDLLTALATPLIFFAVAEAFVRTNITRRQGMKMFTICAINIAVAFAIGLSILNFWQPGKSWSADFAKDQEKQVVPEPTGSSKRPTDSNVKPAETQETRAPDPAKVDKPAKAKSKVEQIQAEADKKSLSPLEMVKGYIPKSFLQPFVENMVLTVAVLAILIGAALRMLKRTADGEMLESLLVWDHLFIGGYQIILKLLMWLIELAPYAVCLAVIGVIADSGLKAFQLIAVFFATTVSALSIHALLYYPLTAWFIGGKHPAAYFREGLNAILTGFSINSSLATAPLTLDALKRLGVSDSSARLSACVGTNFNNDGITLYEAMTALFIAQVAGLDLTLPAQISILLAALAGSMGIAGIPNSGLIILTLVLKAANLPNEAIQFAFPIVLSIDFLIARLRSAVNVMGDLQVAILLDAGEKKPAA